MTDKKQETAEDLMLDLSTNGPTSIIAKIVANAVLAKLPQIVSAGVVNGSVALNLADGRQIDLTPAVARELADMSTDDIQKALST